MPEIPKSSEETLWKNVNWSVQQIVIPGPPPVKQRVLRLSNHDETKVVMIPFPLDQAIELGRALSQPDIERPTVEQLATVMRRHAG